MGTATTGYNYLLYVNTENDPLATPIFVKVAGQRGVTLNRTLDSVEVTDKDSDNWAEHLPSIRRWTADLDNLVELDDGGYQRLDDMYKNRRTVLIQQQNPDGSIEQGLVHLTDFSSEAPHDGEASASVSFQGTGPLTTIPA